MGSSSTWCPQGAFTFLSLVFLVDAPVEQASSFPSGFAELRSTLLLRQNDERLAILRQLQRDAESLPYTPDELDVLIADLARIEATDTFQRWGQAKGPPRLHHPIRQAAQRQTPH
jgi:hypothetical protein